MKKFTKFSAYLLVLLMLAALLSGCLSAPAEQSPGDVPPISVEENGAEPALDEYGSYTTKEDVALYIHTYGRLPGNFITTTATRYLRRCSAGMTRARRFSISLPTATRRRR